MSATPCPSSTPHACPGCRGCSGDAATPRPYQGLAFVWRATLFLGLPLVGAIAGAVLGRSHGADGPTFGALGGLALGGTLGWLVARLAGGRHV